MFVANSLVVYPGQGVGIIERIDSKDIGGLQCEFYIVRIKSNNITLLVPVQNALSVGLRPLVDEITANDILMRLKSQYERSINIGQNWNRRFRDYSGRLKSPDLNVVAEVMAELLQIGRLKELSFGERRLLEQAMSLVSGEIAEVLELDQEFLREDILNSNLPEPAMEEIG